MKLEDLEPEDFMSLDFVHRVGMVTLAWAYVEYGLDYTIREIFRHHDGGSVQTDVPVSLKSKLAFLRKSFNRQPTLSHLKSTGLKLVQCTRLRDLRHDCVHGIMSNLEGPITYRFQRFKYDGPAHTLEAYGYTLRDLKALASLVANLGERLSILTDALEGRDVDKALREIAASKLAVPIPKKKLMLDAGVKNQR